MTWREMKDEINKLSEADLDSQVVAEMTYRHSADGDFHPLVGVGYATEASQEQLAVGIIEGGPVLIIEGD